ncbi:hypothetical protein ACFV1L_10550 [Kitasatospora sp. NPDC059646]|uniref:hypothetical protein n=1 Tax=Kitasatospora sp. NPDC059646 TaxID=3346893 RepID=UPI003681133E
MTQPVQPLDLDTIQARAVEHAEHQTRMGWSCCRSHASADDVPTLIARVRELEAVLGDHRQALREKHAETARALSSLTRGDLEDARARLAYLTAFGTSATSTPDDAC